MYDRIMELEQKVSAHDKEAHERLTELQHHDFVDHDDHRIHYQSEEYIEVEK